MREKMARYCSAGILLLIALLLGYFYLTGRLSAYIHPGFRPLVFISSIVLLILFVGLLVSKVPWGCANPECFDQHGRITLGKFFVYGAVALPLLGTAVLTRDSYGATTVLNRGFMEDVRFLAARTSPPTPSTERSSRANTVAPALPGHDGPDTGSFQYAQGFDDDDLFEPYDYLRRNEHGHITAEVLDLLFAAEEANIRQDFDGQTVEVIGQVFPAATNNPRGDRFRLMRMFMVCCAADAQPIAVLVEGGDWIDQFSEMQWVRVTGQVAFPFEGGRRLAIIHADEVEPTRAPQEIMLF